ncbi:MAG: lactate racemase domain-containing protein [Candidatus Ratteibacteria bacterium]
MYPKLQDPQKELSQYLRKPVGCKPLAEIVRDKKLFGVCIVISDHTRDVPNKIILPVVIDELFASGVSKKSIFILIGNGTHRPTTKQEKMVGYAVGSSNSIPDYVPIENYLTMLETNAKYGFIS